MKSRRITYVCIAALIGALAIGVGVIQARARRNAEIAESLLRFDGTVYAMYGDYEYTPPLTVGSLVLGRGQRMYGFSVRRGEPPLFAKLLEPLVGDQAFSEIYAVYWDYEPVTDSDLVLLDQVPHLRELHISGANVTDAGIPQIIGLRRLAVLDLSQTRVTSDGVQLLTACSELKELNLWGVEIDESLLRELERSLPQCTINR